MLEGHASLADICGGEVTLDDMAILSIATSAWADAERRGRKTRR